MKLPSLHQQLDSCPLPVSTWRAHSLPCLSNQWVCAEETNVPARYGRRLNKCVQEWAPTTGRRSALHLVATIVVCCEDFLCFFSACARLRSRWLSRWTCVKGVEKAVNDGRCSQLFLSPIPTLCLMWVGAGRTATGVWISDASFVDLRWWIVLKCFGVFPDMALIKLSDWRGHPLFYLTPSR